MIEAIERLCAKDRVRVILCGCESCGHMWLVAEGREVPRRCARCKARTWNRAKAREVQAPAPMRRRRKRTRTLESVPSVPVPSISAPTEPGGSPAGVRCPRCGRKCLNSFALEMHECGR
jgi:phage FluMu protein Com